VDAVLPPNPPGTSSYFQYAESHQNIKMIGSSVGFPKTIQEYYEAMQADENFKTRYVNNLLNLHYVYIVIIIYMHSLTAYIDDLVPSKTTEPYSDLEYAEIAVVNQNIERNPSLYYYDESNFNAIDSLCPNADCNTLLKPSTIVREAWQRGYRNQPPIVTSECSQCNTLFSHNQVMVQRLRNYSMKLVADSKAGNISRTVDEEDFSELELDFFRCLPPDIDDMFKAEDVIKFGLCLCDFQCHYACHTASCFKKTTRNPMGRICRYMCPWLAVALKSCFDKRKSKFFSSRPIGTEYYNTTNLVWAQISKSNSDCQVLINSPGEDGLKPTVYVTKYAFKRQNDESNLIMKIGLISKGIRRALSETDNGNLSPAELGRRVLNKILYYFSAPIDLPYPLAALCIINDGLFYNSADPVYCDLSLCNACFSNGFNESEFENEVDESDKYFNFNIHVSKLKEKKPALNNEEAAIDEHGIDNDEEAAVDEHGIGDAEVDENSFVLPKTYGETEEKINLCIMQEYWSRPKSFATINYITYLEEYTLSEGKKKYMIRNTDYVCKLFIVKGRQLPNKRTLRECMSDENFYYKSMLTLFKPTFGKNDLKSAAGILLYIYIYICIF